MKIFKLGIVFILILFQNLGAQIDSYFPSIDRSDIPGARFREPLVFNSESIDQYLNEDASLFREFNCIDAWVSELALNKGKYRLEIYRTTGPEDAFGLFSVLKQNCIACNDFPPYSCRTGKQLLAARGRYLIKVLAEKETASDSAAIVQITGAVAGRIAEPSAELSGYLPDYDISEACDSIILLRGKTGVLRSYPVISAYLKDSVFETAVVLTRNGTTTFSLKFGDADGIMKFASLRNWRTKSADQYGNLMESGEIVKVLSENQLIITLRK